MMSIFYLGIAILLVTFVVYRLHNQVQRLEKRLDIVHWENWVLARFFSNMGIEFNYQPLDKVTPQFFDAIHRERPDYLLGIVHTIQVEMHGEGDTHAGVLN